jgi:hypothetical protein
VGPFSAFGEGSPSAEASLRFVLPDDGVLVRLALPVVAGLDAIHNQPKQLMFSRPTKVFFFMPLGTETRKKQESSSPQAHNQIEAKDHNAL